MSTGQTVFTLSAEMANPTPELPPLGLTIMAFTPMTLPARFRSGPPELPGLTGASV